MSTTFGIKIEGVDRPVEIAHRHGIGRGKAKIQWLNPLASILNDDVPVIPLDNTAQGISTIGDIKKHIASSENGEKEPPKYGVFDEDDYLF